MARGQRAPALGRHPLTTRRATFLLVSALWSLAPIHAALWSAAPPAAAEIGPRTAQQTTTLVSASVDGSTPNGPSFRPVISGDQRSARILAFDSLASDLVPGDVNGHSDVFWIRRAPKFSNRGGPWLPGPTRLLSRGLGDAPADGPSWAPAVGGNFDTPPRCVGFLSAATNLVAGDTNGKVDAFLSHGPGKRLERLSLPGGLESTQDSSAVAVSGDCTRAAFVAAGRLYVQARDRTLAPPSKGPAADPAFAVGKGNDLVYATPQGVWRSPDGTQPPSLIVRGGRNPSYNAIKNRVVAYERDGQVMFDVLDPERATTVLASAYIANLGISTGLVSTPGNGPSRNPQIANSGFYVAFDTEATNLGTTASRGQGDFGPVPDVYLYTAVRHMTLRQTVAEKLLTLPLGGTRPALSFYGNYIFFESAAFPGTGPQRILLRYLGPA